MTTRERAKSRRRNDILQAARELMRDPGELGFSMRTLAERAGVSIATPYNLFGSKQAVLVGLLDADLRAYERALGKLHVDAIGVLFDAVVLMTELFRQEPDFYRNVLAAVSRDGGPELRHMVSGPRYALWKKLLAQATEAGLLDPTVDADAFAVTVTQLMAASVLEWAQGTLDVEEMEARIQYGLALALLAIALPASRKQLDERMRAAEQRLRQLWRAALEARLAEGPVDDGGALADRPKRIETREETA